MVPGFPLIVGVAGRIIEITAVVVVRRKSLRMTIEKYLLTCATLSTGGYILLRRGVAGKPKREKWKVNVRRGRRELTVTGMTMQDALRRAVARLQEDDRRNGHKN
jgi:hypothetical protein